jgi:hypothetical protein
MIIPSWESFEVIDMGWLLTIIGLSEELGVVTNHQINAG